MLAGGENAGATGAQEAQVQRVSVWVVVGVGAVADLRSERRRARHVERSQVKTQEKACVAIAPVPLSRVQGRLALDKTHLPGVVLKAYSQKSWTASHL